MGPGERQLQAQRVVCRQRDVTPVRYFAKKPTEECDAFFKRKCDMIGEQVVACDLTVARARSAA